MKVDKGFHLYRNMRHKFYGYTGISVYIWSLDGREILKWLKKGGGGGSGRKYTTARIYSEWMRQGFFLNWCKAMYNSALAALSVGGEIAAWYRYHVLAVSSARQNFLFRVSATALFAEHQHIDGYNVQCSHCQTEAGQVLSVHET